MAYRKRFTVRKNGDFMEWDIDPNSGDTKIKSTSAFEMTQEQLRLINEILAALVRLCKDCGGLTSIEYSTIEEE